jgi:hypothetical protein
MPNLPFRRVLAVAGIFGTLLPACSSSPTQAVVTSPTPDPVTQRYVALAHSYWIQYKTAEGDIPRFVKACWGASSEVSPRDPAVVDPPLCQEIAAAILTPHKQFLSSLDSTPAPAKFANDDQVLRTQLPKAIADVTAMEAAARAGDRASVIQYMTAYVDDMVPPVLTALDEVDPSVVHT